MVGYGVVFVLLFIVFYLLMCVVVMVCKFVEKLLLFKYINVKNGMSNVLIIIIIVLMVFDIVIVFKLLKIV